MAQTIVTGKQLQKPHRVYFTATEGQRLFNVNAAEIGNETDLNNADSIVMLVDGYKRNESDHSINAALVIVSDDPQGNAGDGWYKGAKIEFEIWFFTH